MSEDDNIPMVLMVNANGLFGCPQAQHVVSASALNAMEKKISALPEPDRQDAVAALSAVKKLPVMHAGSHGSSGLYHMIAATNGFSNSSKSNAFFYKTKLKESEWNQDVAPLLLASQPILDTLAKLANIAPGPFEPGWNWSVVRKAAIQHQHLQDGSWTVRHPDHVKELGVASSYAVYMCGRNGYLNSKGEVGPLAGAVMFESAEGAVRSCKARSYVTNYVIAQVSASLTAVVDASHMDPGANYDPVKDALAVVERDAITQALAKLQNAPQSRVTQLEELLRQHNIAIPEEPSTDKPTKKHRL